MRASTTEVNSFLRAQLLHVPPEVLSAVVNVVVRFAEAALQKEAGAVALALKLALFQTDGVEHLQKCRIKFWHCVTLSLQSWEPAIHMLASDSVRGMPTHYRRCHDGGTRRGLAESGARPGRTSSTNVGFAHQRTCL